MYLVFDIFEKISFTSAIKRKLSCIAFADIVFNNLLVGLICLRGFQHIKTNFEQDWFEIKICNKNKLNKIHRKKQNLMQISTNHKTDAEIIILMILSRGELHFHKPNRLEFLIAKCFFKNNSIISLNKEQKCFQIRISIRWV